MTSTNIFLSVSACVTWPEPVVLWLNLPNRSISPLRLVSELPLGVLSDGNCKAPSLVDFDFTVKASGGTVETSARPFLVDRAKAWNNGGGS